MKRDEILKKYRSQNLVIETGFDKPGTVYRPHRHGQTKIFTVDGSISIRLGRGLWQTLGPDSEILVASNQLHEAVVWPEGWAYITAWDKNEAKRYGQH